MKLHTFQMFFKAFIYKFNLKAVGKTAGAYFYPEFTRSLQKKKTDFICGFYTESEEPENSFFIE